jgi:hypothetical protein
MCSSHPSWISGALPAPSADGWDRHHSAFDAIARTLALGSVGYENAINEKDERLIWLDRAVVDRLRAFGEGESYSDVIRGAAEAAI